MMSSTARYSIKPKNLTLFEICQSINDHRHPPPSVSSYQFQYQSSVNTGQILTRRLYLHPLSINPNQKQQVSKTSTNAPTTVATPSNSEQHHQLNYDKNRVKHHTKNKLSHRGLAVLSSSFPLTTRMNSKPDTRHSRDKTSMHNDGDMNSDYDGSTTTGSFNQFSLPSITRGTLSTTRSLCTRPAGGNLTNRRKIYTKPNRFEKIDVWHHLGQTLERPMPIDPPTTPLINVSDFNIENDEPQNSYISYNSIQAIKIYKRYPIHNPFTDEDNEYDDYIYNIE